MPHLLLACLAALAAAALYAAAVTLQALEARRAPAELHLRTSLIVYLLWRRRLWVLGTALGLLGWPLQALALAFAPLALVQPIMGLSVLGLLAAGHRILGEPISRRSALAASAIVAGIVVLAVTVPTGGGAANGSLLAVALAILGVLTVAPLLTPRCGPLCTCQRARLLGGCRLPPGRTRDDPARQRARARRRVVRRVAWLALGGRQPPARRQSPR